MRAPVTSLEPSLAPRRHRGRRGGFTLLETIIALGILAVGATTALALLVSAAATGRRAEHLVSSALLADSVFTEIELKLNGAFDPSKLEAVDAAGQPRVTAFGDGPIRATPPVDPRGSVARGLGPGPRVAPDPPTKDPKGPAKASNGPPRAFAEDPFAKAGSRYFAKGASLSSFPDYKYDVILTPIGGPPDEPWEFLVEVEVRWSERGKPQDRHFATVLLKKIGHLDNEVP